MGEHHALGVTGRTRGVGKGQRMIGGDGVREFLEPGVVGRHRAAYGRVADETWQVGGERRPSRARRRRAGSAGRPGPDATAASVPCPPGRGRQPRCAGPGRRSARCSACRTCCRAGHRHGPRPSRRSSAPPAGHGDEHAIAPVQSQGPPGHTVTAGDLAAQLRPGQGPRLRADTGGQRRTLGVLPGVALGSSAVIVSPSTDSLQLLCCEP